MNLSPRAVETRKSANSNDILIGWKLTPQYIRTEYVRELPIGHN